MLRLTLICLILCAGESQERRAREKGRTAQVVLWPSVYTEQNAIWDSVTPALTAYLIQYSTVQHSIVQYSTVKYSTL